MTFLPLPEMIGLRDRFSARANHARGRSERDMARALDAFRAASRESLIDGPMSGRARRLLIVATGRHATSIESARDAIAFGDAAETWARKVALVQDTGPTSCPATRREGAWRAA